MPVPLFLSQKPMFPECKFAHSHSDSLHLVNRSSGVLVVQSWIAMSTCEHLRGSKRESTGFASACGRGSGGPVEITAVATIGRSDFLLSSTGQGCPPADKIGVRSARIP